MTKKISIMFFSLCLGANLLAVEENKKTQDVSFKKECARLASWPVSIVGWTAVSLPLVVGISASVLGFDRDYALDKKIALVTLKISAIYSEHLFKHLILGSSFILGGRVLSAYVNRVEKSRDGRENHLV